MSSKRKSFGGLQPRRFSGSNRLVPPPTDPTKRLKSAHPVPQPIQASALSTPPPPPQVAAAVAVPKGDFRPTRECEEKKNWVGANVSSVIPVELFALLARMLPKPTADRKEWVELDDLHLTLVHGNDPKDWQAIVDTVINSGFQFRSLKFAELPYLVERTPTKEYPEVKHAYWVVEVISPELVALKDQLWKKFAPKTEKPSPPHVTLRKVKPILFNAATPLGFATPKKLILRIEDLVQDMAKLTV